MRSLLLLVALSSVATPAHAQAIATPYGHLNFGDVEIRRGGGGLALGYLGGWIGFELDVDFHLHFFKDGDLESIPNACAPGAAMPCVDVDTDALIFGANAVLPIPILEGTRWRLYGTMGIGLIHVWIHDAGPLDAQQTDFALNLGGGAIFWILDWFGVRADVRYLHAFVDEDAHQAGRDHDYDFARLFLGVTFAPF